MDTTLKAFTYRSNGILNRLETDVYVYSDYNTHHPESSNKWKSLWDTGASNTCISHRVVEELNLIPIGKNQTRTANDFVDTDVYVIDILLPNHVSINNVSVFALDLYECDLLIGMDIIQLGDLSITNHMGHTQFSFRIPSMKHIDFVAEEKALRL